MNKENLKSFPACLAISTLLTVAPLFFTDIFYMFGDDYLINYIANGSFGDKWSAHLVFVKYPAGLLLKALYGIAPSFNWYAALLIGSMALSFALILRAVFLTTSHPAAPVFVLIMNAAAVPLFLTFTVASFLAAAAGFVSLLAVLRRDEHPIRLIPGVLMLALSYNLRKNCLVPMAGIAFPAFFSLLLEKIKEQKLSSGLIRKAALAAAGTVILVGCTEISDRAAYSSDEWKSYLAYTSARSSYLDYPTVEYETFQPQFLDAGFSKEAYLLINRWTFCEKNVFSTERLKEVADIAHSAMGKRYRLRYTVDELSGSPTRYCILIPLILLLTLAAGSPGFKKKTAAFTFVMLVMVLCALAFLRLRVLLRITVPLAMGACAFISMCAGGRPDSKMRKIFSAAGCAVLALMLFLFFGGYKDAVAGLRSKSTAQSYNELRSEIDRHPDSTYVIESSIYVHLFQWGHTIDEVVKTDTFKHVFRGGSWDSYSPRFYEEARELGVSDPDNLLSSLSDTENMYLVTEDDGFVLDFLNHEYWGGYSTAEEKMKGAARICTIRK
ncbi:MAG: hypothetical protein Q4G47_03405 [Lachnospiraceae bacterium]|nr:hypothetical protein [Lachnospiraceae bacterium]